MHGLAGSASVYQSKSLSVRKWKLTEGILCAVKVFLWKFCLPLGIELRTGYPPHQNTHTYTLLIWDLLCSRCRRNIGVLLSERCFIHFRVGMVCVCMLLCVSQKVRGVRVRSHHSLLCVTWQQVTSVKQERSQACSLHWWPLFWAEISCRQNMRLYKIMILFLGLGHDEMFTSWSS